MSDERPEDFHREARELSERSDWIQTKDGLWWQLMPVGPFPQPRELTDEERIESAIRYMRSKMDLAFTTDVEAWIERFQAADPPPYWPEDFPK